jgi:hypothetical protein
MWCAQRVESRRKRVMLIKIRRACRELEIVKSAKISEKKIEGEPTEGTSKKYYYNLLNTSQRHSAKISSKQN